MNHKIPTGLLFVLIIAIGLSNALFGSDGFVRLFSQVDITILRIAATLASFVTFIGILVWAYSRRRAADFEAASLLPFEQD
jgi:cytochrome c oxidase cbb3-type subunit 4